MPVSLKVIHEELSGCRRCVLAGHEIVSPPIFSGPSGARLMIVGQAPGRVEAMETHMPFSGPSGKRLFRWLAEAGWEEGLFRHTQYMTAITKCYPGSNPSGRGDRVPSVAEQALCRPWLEQELALVMPEVVVPVGGLAIRRFLSGPIKLIDVVGRRFARPNDDPGLTRWARHHLPATTCVVPLPHPSGASQWLNHREHRLLVERALAHIKAK